MKNIRILLSVLCLSALLPACKEDDPETFAPQPSVIASLEESSFELPEESENPYFFRMNWTKTKFFSASGEPVWVDGIEYEVQADLSDNDFSAPVSVAKTSGLYLDIYAQTLRDICGHYAEEESEEPLVLSFRIKSTGGGMSVCSEPVLLTVVPYTAPPVITDIEESTLDELQPDTYTLVYQGVKNPKVFTVTWNATQFYLDDSSEPSPVSPVSYTLQIDRSNNDFADPRTLATTSSLSADVHANALNSILMNDFGATAGHAYEVELRLLIAYGEGESAGETVSSNQLTLYIVPFADFDPLQAVYIYGQNINNWGLSDFTAMYPMFKTDSETSNYVYTYTGYMPQGAYKFMPEMSLGTDMAFCLVADGAPDVEISATGIAFWNQTAGFKTITLDTHNMTYSIADYDAGSATVWNTMCFFGTFSGWDPSRIPMTRFSDENNHIWTLDTSIEPSDLGYHCGKFIADGSYDNLWQNILGKDWSTPYGTMIFRQETDVNVYFGAEAARLRVVFNDLTGQYAIFRK